MCYGNSAQFRGIILCQIPSLKISLSNLGVIVALAFLAPAHSVAQSALNDRFNDGHGINSIVFDLSRDSSKVIQRDIQFGENFFSPDTVINATSDLTIFRLAYTYSFIRLDDGSLGVTAGT